MLPVFDAMPRKSLIFSMLLAVLTLVAVAGAFTSFQRKRSSFERLDFRFHWSNGIIQVDQVDPGSVAEEAGLRAGDQIWMVAGAPSTEVDGLKRTLRRLGPTPLLVARGNQTLTLRYTAPELKIDYRYLFLTLIGFLHLAIGLFTLFRGGRDESLLFYFVSLLAFVVFVYSPAGKTDGTYTTLWLIEDFARVFLPPLTLHFFLRFPQPLLRQRWIIPSIYAAPVLLGIFDLVLYNTPSLARTGALDTLFIISDRWQMFHFAVYFTLAFVALTYTYRTAPAVGPRKQIKWIYLGMAVGFIPFLVLYLIPFITTGSGSAYTTVAILPLVFIPLAFAVSILKYKLWDVEVITKEILAYTITFVFGMIAFSTVNLLASQFLEERLALERNFLAFASGLLIAGVLVPVKGRIETLIDMVLYRDTYRHRRTMHDFAQELATFHDLHDLIEIVRERLGAAIHLHRMNLYLKESDRFVLYVSEPGVPARIGESELAKLPLDEAVVLDEPRLGLESESLSTLRRVGYRYLFPLRHRSELEGMLICGTKLGEEALSRDDLQLIGSLTAPVALAVVNARLYGRLRRQIEEIRSLKEYNESIIESSSSAIVVVDDRTILTANQAFWDLVGVEAGDAHSIDELFPPYEEIKHIRSIDVAVEQRFVNRRGDEKEVTVTAGPFNAPDAPSGAKVLVIGDISERVRLERELQDKERLASLGLLAAGVAHEVNTPLTGISSYAQLLLAETSPDDPRYATLKKMELQTFRAAHLVNNLLDFAASRNRGVECVALADVVRSTVAIHEDLMQSKDVELHLSELPEIGVEGNFFELQQVLTNLLLNARDAVKPGGNIWVSIAKNGSRAELKVRDDGCGIPEALQSEIFNPLVSTKRAQGGTGLGLAISDRIVRGIGGAISVSSRPEAGATFSVLLPLWSPRSG